MYPNAATHPVVAQARTWIGTRFEHQGRSKLQQGNPGACDCLGLIVGVCKELNLPAADHDQCDYPSLPKGNKLQQTLDQVLTIHHGLLEPGLVALFEIGGHLQHVGIISDYPCLGLDAKEPMLGLIHCHARAHKVVEHRLDKSWLSRLIKCYTLICSR